MIEFFIVLWLIGLSIIVWYIFTGYRKFTRYEKHAQIRELLESILAKQDHLSVKNNELDLLTQKLAKNDIRHLQRIGIVRFNPFADTGGSQSFSLSILDEQSNGIVMTSLYGRNSNRWYVKEVAGGKGKDFELSKEEESAIRIAMSKNTKRV
jgi:hypothetical protein